MRPLSGHKNKVLSQLTDDPGVLVVGRFGRPHGVKGWLRLFSFTDPTDNLLEYQSHWKIATADGWQPVIASELTQRNNNFLIRLEGHSTPEQASQLTNCDIYIDRKHLPTLADREYYWSDLIGLTVTNTAGIELGTVVNMLETGSNDVLVVRSTEPASSTDAKPRSQDTLIPYLLDDVVLAIDLEKRTLQANWDPDF